MTTQPKPLEIPPDILAAVYREARQSYPAECCGWLAGPRGGAAVSLVRPCVNAQEQGTHPSKPERTAETAYVFTGQDLMELNRSLDGDEPALVIYHSPPQRAGVPVGNRPGGGDQPLGRRAGLSGSATGGGN